MYKLRINHTILSQR